jgi:hypothetical protein
MSTYYIQFRRAIDFDATIRGLLLLQVSLESLHAVGQDIVQDSKGQMCPPGPKWVYFVQN